MAPKEIVWSPLAKLQLVNVLKFYVQRNGNSIYSLKIVSEVEDLLETLSKAERIGRCTFATLYLIIYENRYYYRFARIIAKSV